MSVLEYKCLNCGSALRFDSSVQQLACGHCGTTYDVATLQQYAADQQLPAEDEVQWQTYDASSGSGDWQAGEAESMLVQSCPSCGGEIIADRNTAATKCPYCENPAIISSQLAGVFRPDLVLPFQVDKQAVATAFTKFMDKKPLLPRLFKERNKPENISGIYVPFWLFDCATDARIRYRATTSRAWSDGNYRYVQTNHYSLLREGTLSFANVPVDGSLKMDDTHMEAIEPFEFSAAKDFHTGYLSGFLAEKYDQDAEACKPRANERVKTSTEQAFSRTTSGFQTTSVESSHIELKHGSIRYALLPVWMLNTKFKDRIYQFSMNGQTGRLIGELPVDWGKFWMWFGGLFAGFSLIGTALVWMFG